MSIEDLISRYVDGELSSEEESELHHRLAVSPEQRKLFRQHIMLRGLAQNRELLQKPTAEMRGALFARLQREEGFKAAVPPGTAFAAPVVPGSAEPSGISSESGNNPGSDTPTSGANASGAKRATGYAADAAPIRRTEQVTARRRRRLIPFLLIFMVALISGTALWQVTRRGTQSGIIATADKPLDRTSVEPPIDPKARKQTATSIESTATGNSSSTSAAASTAATPSGHTHELAALDSRDEAVAATPSHPDSRAEYHFSQSRGRPGSVSGSRARSSEVLSGGAGAGLGAPHAGQALAMQENDDAMEKAAPRTSMSANPTTLASGYSDGNAERKGKAPSADSENGPRDAVDNQLQSISSAKEPNLQDALKPRILARAEKSARREAPRAPEQMSRIMGSTANAQDSSAQDNAVPSGTMAAVAPPPPSPVYSMPKAITLANEVSADGGSNHPSNYLSVNTDRRDSNLNVPASSATKYSRDSSEPRVAFNDNALDPGIQRSRWRASAGISEGVMVNGNDGAILSESLLRLGAEFNDGRDAAYILAGYSGYRQNVDTFVLTSSIARPSLHSVRTANELWVGAEYRHTMLSSRKWTVRAGLLGGAGAQYLRGGLELPVSVEITRSISASVSPVFEYVKSIGISTTTTTAQGTANETTVTTSPDNSGIRAGVSLGVWIVVP